VEEGQFLAINKSSLTVIARKSFVRLRINSTTEAIPFLEFCIIKTFICDLNVYDLDNIYTTNIK
jgi:hypothetical protein